MASGKQIHPSPCEQNHSAKKRDHSGLKTDAPFDEALRRAMLVKPVLRPAKKKTNKKPR